MTPRRPRRLLPDVLRRLLLFQILRGLDRPPPLARALAPSSSLAAPRSSHRFATSDRRRRPRPRPVAVDEDDGHRRSGNAAPLSSTSAPVEGGSARTVAPDDPPLRTGGGAAVDVDVDPFALLSSLAATTLLQSDRRRDAAGKAAGAQASSATNWIDEGSAFALRRALDKLRLFLPGEDGDADGRDGREGRDEAVAWLRWMRSMPRPVVVDLSVEARGAANETVSDDFLALLDAAAGAADGGSDAAAAAATKKAPGPSKARRLRTEFLSRLRCQLVLLPSGQGLRGSLREPPGSLTFGKLLCGGVTRYRLLPSGSGSGSGGGTPRPPRRAGERTERKASRFEHVPSWVQYGGTERRYDAADMGPAMVLEWSLLPKIQGGSGAPGGAFDGGADGTREMGDDMTLRRIAWSPRRMFRYVDDDEGERGPPKESGQHRDVEPQYNTPMTLQGKDRNDAFASDFRARVGGLGPQIDAIVRRVLDGRVVRPAEVDGAGNPLSYGEAKERTGADGPSLDDAARSLSRAALEAEALASLGLAPVRGLLLHGPPGCGKTALAREIARALRARAPKIVSAPELLDRWVGGSERLVRELFHDAEAELASVNGDASRSALHVIVIDEIDATFRKRTSAEDSGEATRSSTVNQILAKLDGVEAIPNVLLIGMTNRRELLDEALLRPGRLEVQIEIPLPDMEGRREILNIHFAALRSRGRLSQPLCSAIDGTGDISQESDALTAGFGNEDSTPDRTKGRKRRALKRATNNVIDYLSPGKRSGYDLASDDVTGGFSGADLEGLVRCAGSIALSRARKEGAGVESLLITLDDVKQALVEVKV